MPTSGRPRPSTLDHPTRQQLDELDALMQRMLALPVNQPEDPVAPSKEQLPSETALESPSASSPSRPGAEAGRPHPVPTLESPIQEDRAAETEAVPPSSTLALSPLSPSRDEVESRGDSPRVASTPASSVFAGLDSPRKVQEKFARPSARPEEIPQTPSVAWPLRPLLWINLAFDQGTAWLGPLGRWVRGPGGRAVLGWIGFLLLAAALAWVALDGAGGVLTTR